MTSEEIRATIERLREVEPFDSVGSAVPVEKVVWGFMGGTVSVMEFRDAIIDLLRQADPDTHMKLPKDADGEYIHIGDKVEYEYMADKEMFTVKRMEYCKKHGWYLGDACIEYPTSEYELYDPIYCRHHHKPTVVDILNEYADKWNNVCKPEEEAELLLKYADKLREVMADE